MAGWSDGSAIKALFSPNKGDPLPQKKKIKSTFSKNAQTKKKNRHLHTKSKVENYPPPIKNAPPPDHNVKSPLVKNTKIVNPLILLPYRKTKMLKQQKIVGQRHRKFRSTLMIYSSGQRLSPAKCRSMVLCSLWRK